MKLVRGTWISQKYFANSFSLKTAIYKRMKRYIHA